MVARCDKHIDPLKLMQKEQQGLLCFIRARLLSCGLFYDIESGGFNWYVCVMRANITFY